MEMDRHAALNITPQEKDNHETNTINDPEEEAKLREALAECKRLLVELNNQLARKESFERLLDIYAQFCPKSYTIYNRHLRFTKHDLLQHKRLRQLLHSDNQIRVWSATRRKLFQVLCLILNDIMVFLRIESSPNGSSSNPPIASGPAAPPSSACTQVANNLQQQVGSQTFQQSRLTAADLDSTLESIGQPHSPLNSLASNASISVKYYFANIDQKSSVISLSKLLVREKAVNDAEPRVYLISSSPHQPEMYELAFMSKRHQLNFVEKLKSCIEKHTRNLELSLNDLDDLEDDRIIGNVYDLDYQEDEDEDSELEILAHQADLNDCSCWQQQQQHRSCCQMCDNQNSDEDRNESDRMRRQEFNNSSNNNKTLNVDSEFELDIEQDVVAPPRESSPIGGSQCGNDSNNYEQPVAAHKSAGSGSETDERSSSRLESHESGLSERAKDSLDETAPSRQKLRSVRRRRAQRPRQVSNQSSSSSEAVHRQAIQLISTAFPASEREEEVDSGRGRDEDSSSSAASTSSGPDSLIEARRRETNMSTESSTEKSGLQQQMATEFVGDADKKTNSGELEELQQQVATVAPSGVSCAPNDTANSATGNATRSGSTNLVKCSSILSKSNCSFAKQRKLSTVSTMSSQLKLINRLKLSSGFGCVSSSSSGQQQLSQQQSCCLYCCNDQSCNNQNGESPKSSLSKQMRQQIRRSSFVPEQKLEELRNLRIQLDKDKQEWQAKFDKMQEQLLNERRELDLAREKLKMDRQQVANEREQLYRKLDVLKEKGILLSPSHKVIITTPETRFNSPQTQLTEFGKTNYYQQQTVNYQRQPLQQMSGNYCNSSIRNVQQQQQHFQTNGISLNSSLELSGTEQQTMTMTRGKHQSTNLFIQSSPTKVPLHLSENSTTTSARQQSQLLTYSTSRVPLIGMLTGTSLLTNSIQTAGKSSSTST